MDHTVHTICTHIVGPEAQRDEWVSSSWYVFSTDCLRSQKDIYIKKAPDGACGDHKCYGAFSYSLLEGDGSLALVTSVHLMTQFQVISVDQYSIVATIAKNGDPGFECQLVACVKTCVSLSYTYFKKQV